MMDSRSNHVKEKRKTSPVHPKIFSYSLPHISSPPMIPNFPYSFLTPPTPLIPLLSIDLFPHLPRTPLDFLKDSNTHPNKPHNRRHDTVSNFPFGRIIAELESQAAVDYPQGDDYPANPDVCMRPDRANMVFFEVGVVSQAAKGLYGEQADDDDTDNWVIVAELCAGKVVLV